jgi:hypothetical protein
MTPPSLVIGLAATRQSGKDTLARHLTTLNWRFTRWAFADQLKADIRPFIADYFDIDIEDCTQAEKEIVRPLLIAYGCAQRAVNPTHWVDLVVTDIRRDTSGPLGAELIPVVTDVRFPNEATRLREEFGAAFKLINVTRVGAPAPTDEEEKHFRQVASMADFHLHWGGENEAEQVERAREVLGWLGVKESKE